LRFPRIALSSRKKKKENRMLEAFSAGVIDCVLWLLIKLTQLYRWVFSSLFVSRVIVLPENEIVSAVKNRTSSLHHIGAILENGTIDPFYVAHLASLMINSASEAVTIFQEKGTLAAEIDAIVQLLQTEFSVSFSSVCVEVKSAEKEQVVNKTGGRKVLLQFLTEKQSERDFVEGAVRGIVSDVQKGKLSEKNIDREEISRRLFVQTPDPELVLCFAGPKRNGFLPWHIRLTEFFDAHRLQDFRLHNFVQLLKRFSKTEQRFGA
jgi:hypothetical protein